MERLPWIIQMGPKQSQGSLCEKEEDKVQSQDEIGGCYTAGFESEEKGLEPRNAGSF